MTLEMASKKIIKAIGKRKPIMMMTMMGKILNHMNRLSPLLVRKLLAKSMTKMKTIYTPQLLKDAS